MASKQSILIFRNLFENTFLDSQKSLADLLKEFGRGSFGAWHDNHKKLITDHDVPTLKPEGLVHLMKLQGFTKNYASKEQALIRESLEPYRQPVEVGDVVIGCCIMDGQVDINEITKITLMKVHLQEWYVPTRRNLGRVMVPGDYTRVEHRPFVEYNIGLGYTIITNEPVVRDIRANNKLIPPKELIERVKALERKYKK